MAKTQINKDKSFLEEENFLKEDGSIGCTNNIDENSIYEQDKIVEEEEVLENDKSKKYWNEETEKSVIDFLYLNEFFYESRIKEEEELAIKEKRPINKKYCQEMEKKIQEVLTIKDRYIQREKIFKEHIKIPLQKLVENVLFNYKLFVPGIDIKTQQRDCYNFVYLKFTNFNPWQRTKSFSYYGTIAKHHYLGKRKDSAKDTKTVLDYESNKEIVDSHESEELEIFQPKNNSLKLFNHVIRYLEKEIESGNLTKNDQKVADAIIQIFKNHEIIGVYNKNQVYQLIKENSGLETKDITYCLHRFRVLYKILRQDFNEKNK